MCKFAVFHSSFVLVFFPDVLIYQQLVRLQVSITATALLTLLDPFKVIVTPWTTQLTFKLSRTVALPGVHKSR